MVTGLEGSLKRETGLQVCFCLSASKNDHCTLSAVGVVFGKKTVCALKHVPAKSKSADTPRFCGGRKDGKRVPPRLSILILFSFTVRLYCAGASVLPTPVRRPTK